MAVKHMLLGDAPSCGEVAGSWGQANMPQRVVMLSGTWTKGNIAMAPGTRHRHISSTWRCRPGLDSCCKQLPPQGVEGKTEGAPTSRAAAASPLRRAGSGQHLQRAGR
jgi:hypothetical protein